VCSASVRRIARSHIVPQEAGTTRAKRSLKEPLTHCQGEVRPCTGLFAFVLGRDNQATFLPECVATLPFVNGEVTIRG
jgi:hypothetical protein